MFKTIKFALTASAVVTLVACGGGGGGENGGTPDVLSPVNSSLSFSLITFKNLRQVASSSSFNISGNCTGTGSENSGAPYTTNLHGAAYGKTNVLTLNYKNCTGSGVGTSNVFYDSNFSTIAIENSDGKFVEGTVINAVPATVKVGDTLTITNLRMYSSTAKTTQLYTGVQSIVVDPDTSQSVILRLVTQLYGANNQLYLTTQTRYQLNSNGDVKQLTYRVDSPTGQTETWTYN